MPMPRHLGQFTPLTILTRLPHLHLPPLPHLQLRPTTGPVPTSAAAPVSRYAHRRVLVSAIQSPDTATARGAQKSPNALGAKNPTTSRTIAGVPKNVTQTISTPQVRPHLSASRPLSTDLRIAALCILHRPIHSKLHPNPHRPASRQVLRLRCRHQPATPSKGRPTAHACTRPAAVERISRSASLKSPRSARKTSSSSGHQNTMTVAPVPRESSASTAGRLTGAMSCALSGP